MELLSADWWTEERIRDAVEGALVLLGGIVAARLVAFGVRQLLRRTSRETWARFGSQLTFWVLVGIVAATTLQQLGFDLSLLLGAAGIFTVAFGFASQTSASNLISGVFVVLEGSIQIGDILSVGGIEGQVLAIDALSVKLRTWDNRLVRIPNEVLIKDTFVNLTRFPLRRVDVHLVVPFGTDLAKVEEVLAAVGAANPRVLRDPPIQYFIAAYTDRGIQVQWSPWTATASHYEVKTEVFRQVHDALVAAGISFAVPQLEVGARPPRPSD